MLVRDKDDILQSMISNFSIPDVPIYEGTMTYAILSTIANAINREYVLKNEEEKAIFIEDGYNEYLDERVWEFGYDRKQGLPATGQVTFVGELGKEIPEDTKIKANGILYCTVTGGIIVEAEQTEDTGYGEAVIHVSSLDIGYDKNVKAGTKFTCDEMQFVDIFNEDDIDGGVDIESDEDLRTRFYYTQRNKGVSGNEAHYEEWAKQVAGVRDAKATGLVYGEGTVEVVVGGGDTILDDDTIEAVEDYIQTQRPVGADVTIKAMEDVPVNVNATVESERGDINGIQSEFMQRMTEYLNDVTDVIDVGKVYAHLLLCDGVEEVRDFRLNGSPSDDIELTSTQQARLNEVNIVLKER